MYDLFQLGHDFRQVIVLEQNGRSHIMSSSTNDNLTSIYTGSDGICNSDYDCNSEDVQSENPEIKDGPDSAEISNDFDQESCALGSDGSITEAVSCQFKISFEASKKRKFRMMDEDSDGIRIKIIPCTKEQFRRRMEATKILKDDFTCLIEHNAC